MTNALAFTRSESAQPTLRLVPVIGTYVLCEDPSRKGQAAEQNSGRRSLTCVTRLCTASDSFLRLSVLRDTICRTRDHVTAKPQTTGQFRAPHTQELLFRHVLGALSGTSAQLHSTVTIALDFNHTANINPKWGFV